MSENASVLRIELSSISTGMEASGRSIICCVRALVEITLNKHNARLRTE